MRQLMRHLLRLACSIEFQKLSLSSRDIYSPVMTGVETTLNDRSSQTPHLLSVDDNAETRMLRKRTVDSSYEVTFSSGETEAIGAGRLRAFRRAALKH